LIYAEVYCSQRFHPSGDVTAIDVIALSELTHVIPTPTFERCIIEYGTGIVYVASRSHMHRTGGPALAKIDRL
jgi:hypothetical protein